MGYLPPSAPGLIRQDLEPVLYHLYSIFATSGAFLGQPARRGLPRSFSEYVTELYGQPGRDWLPILNGAAIAALVSLVVTVVVAIVS